MAWIAGSSPAMTGVFHSLAAGLARAISKSICLAPNALK
jgi:hypothetical protein